MKKIILLLLLTVAAAALLTGCASSADTLPSPTPGTENNMLSPLTPDATGSIENPMMNTGATTMPMATSQPMSSGNTVETAQKAAQAMKEAVVKLSEVDEAWVSTPENRHAMQRAIMHAAQEYQKSRFYRAAP